MNKKMLYLVSALLAVFLAAACATKKQDASAADPMPPPPPPPTENPVNNYSVAALKSTVLDWQNRNMNEEPFPAWLRGLEVNKKQSPVRVMFELPDDAAVRQAQAQRRNRDEAGVEAVLNFNAAIANELKTYVCSAAGKVLDQGQMDIVNEVTTATKVTITGARKLADFWQLVETEDNGVKSRQYIWHVVYAFPASTWNQLTRKYVNDVIGRIPDRAVQTKIADAFSEIDAQAKRQDERSDAEFYQQLELQRKAAEDAQKRQMAQIAQQGARDQAAINAAKAQAVTEAEARFRAYKYGDPATAAAASVTANDIDWISALSTVASIVTP
jgi:hypothetical protein